MEELFAGSIIYVSICVHNQCNRSFMMRYCIVLSYGSTHIPSVSGVTPSSKYSIGPAPRLGVGDAVGCHLRGRAVHIRLLGQDVAAMVICIFPRRAAVSCCGVSRIVSFNQLPYGVVGVGDDS